MSKRDCLVSQVLEADRFGNLITNFTRNQMEELLNGRSARITIGSITIDGLSQTYGQAPPGKPVALFNSLERLELALPMGDLREELDFGGEDVSGVVARVEGKI